jgi:hypothetical protein
MNRSAGSYQQMYKTVASTVASLPLEREQRRAVAEAFANRFANYGNFKRDEFMAACDNLYGDTADRTKATLTFELDEEVDPQLFAQKVALACAHRGALREGEAVVGGGIRYRFKGLLETFFGNSEITVPDIEQEGVTDWARAMRGET